jgi:PAS domain S-box-containing protein
MQSKLSILELRQRVRWYVTMRWFYLLPLAAIGLVPLYVSNGFSEDFQRQSLVALLGIGVNVGVLIATRYRFHSRPFYITLAAIQVGFDIFLTTWLIYQNGGIESRSVIAYAIPIFMSSALFGRLAIYFTAIISALAYTLLSTLDHLKYIHPPNVVFPSVHDDALYYVRGVLFYSALLIILAIIADYVGRLIREREQLEEEMRALGAEKAETEAILKTMGSALVAINRKGVVTMVNDVFEDLTGWKRKEAIGRQLDDVLPLLDSDGKRLEGEDRPMLQVSNEASNTDAHVRSISSYSYVRKDGSSFPFVGYMAPIVLGYRVIGSTTVFDDATNSKKLEQLKSNFVALVSHQLKTPIGEIRGYTENMLAGLGGKLTKKQKEYLSHIMNTAERSNKLISDLLDITVLEKGGVSVDIEPVKLSAIIREAVHIYRERLSKKELQLVITEADPKLSVFADSEKLVEVIGNVLANAISYTRQGTITIETKPGKDYGEICIIDEGIGMDKATLDALFHKDEVLSGAPTAEGGTGLGLYLAKQIVTLMEGDIRVASTSEKGTTICIKLPIVKG